MPMIRLATSLVLVFAISAAAACADTSSETEGDDLSASRVQVVGTIQPDQTLSVNYTRSPAYRAYAFAATKGDVVDFWVRGANGSDAYAYILGPTMQTLTSNNNADAQTKDAHVSTTISATGTYYVAFREAAFKDATMDVQYARSEPRASANAVVTCTGRPRFPTTGALNNQGVMLYTYERDCNAQGGCSPWTEKATRAVRGWTNYGTTSVDQGHHAHVEIGLAFYSGYQASATYQCSTTDRGAVWSTELDANGQADMKLRWEDRCNVSGGSGGSWEQHDPRPAHISFGSTCMSIAEVDPPVGSGGRQQKQVYVAKF